MSEFLENPVEPEEVEQPETEDIDVQKAVVESLAADKAEQDEIISSLRKDNNRLQSELAGLRERVSLMREELAKLAEILTRNGEGETSNKISLLDRNAELDDRFVGETRDQVIEVIREARDAAEKAGRVRRAQILESVLLANEPNGELATRRANLEKLFAEHANVMTGEVIEALKNLGLSHKNGEEYLLPSEVIARNY